ncbi:MAG: hypothetical protein ACPHLK_00620 [Gammaproteobacteria bacterium]|jgi:hypothetical protein
MKYLLILFVLTFQINQVHALNIIGSDKEKVSELIQIGEGMLMPNLYSRFGVYRYFNNLEPLALNKSVPIENSDYPKLLEKLGYAKYIHLGLNNYGRCKYEFTLTRLNELVSNLGEQHVYINQWIANQNTVYENCRTYFRSHVSLPKMPENVGAEIEDIVKDDVKYQKAAAYYYSRKYDKAIDTFESLAVDYDSRYRAISKYMLAKIEVDEHSEKAITKINSILTDESLSEVHRITKQLTNIMAYRTHDQKLLVKQLESVNEILLWPAEKIKQNTLNKNIYHQAKTDIGWFLINNSKEELSLTDDWWLNGNAGGYSRAEALMITAEDLEHLDWLQTTYAWGSFNWEVPWLGLNYSRVLNENSKNVTQHAIKRWKNDGGYHWLLAALTRIHPDDQFSDEVLDQFNKVKTRIIENNWYDDDIVLYPSLFFHSIRILLGREEDERAIETLINDIEIKNKYRFEAVKNTILWFIANGKVDKAKLVSKSVNTNIQDFYFWQIDHLDQLRQLLADDLYEFMYLDKIKPSKYSRLRPGSLAVLNLLPVIELNKVLDMEFIGKADRAEIARAAWLRAYLLNKHDILDQLTDKLVKFNPYLEKEIKEIRSTFFNYNKRNKITRMLLTYPRISISIHNSDHLWRRPYYKGKDIPEYLQLDVYNHNDNNWWCSYKIDRSNDSMIKAFYERVIGLPNSDFYYYENTRSNYLNEDIMEYVEHRDSVLSNHAVLKLIDWDELYALTEITQAPEYLTKRSISAYENRNIVDKYISDNKLIQRLLALSVRTTRYGCNRDGEHGTYSRRAFEILHYNYPESEETKRTPYWFN